MKSPNNGDTETQLDISCHQRKLLVPGFDYIQLNLGPKRSHWNLQTNPAVAKTIGFSSQTEIKGPLLKTIPTQVIVHGNV